MMRATPKPRPPDARPLCARPAEGAARDRSRRAPGADEGAGEQGDGAGRRPAMEQAKGSRRGPQRGLRLRPPRSPHRGKRLYRTRPRTLGDGQVGRPGKAKAGRGLSRPDRTPAARRARGCTGPGPPRAACKYSQNCSVSRPAAQRPGGRDRAVTQSAQHRGPCGFSQSLRGRSAFGWCLALSPSSAPRCLCRVGRRRPATYPMARIGCPHRVSLVAACRSSAAAPVRPSGADAARPCGGFKRAGIGGARALRRPRRAAQKPRLQGRGAAKGAVAGPCQARPAHRGGIRLPCAQPGRQRRSFAPDRGEVGALPQFCQSAAAGRQSPRLPRPAPMYRRALGGQRRPRQALGAATAPCTGAETAPIAARPPAWGSPCKGPPEKAGAGGRVGQYRLRSLRFSTGKAAAGQPGPPGARSRLGGGGGATGFVRGVPNSAAL